MRALGLKPRLSSWSGRAGATLRWAAGVALVTTLPVTAGAQAPVTAEPILILPSIVGTPNGAMEASAGEAVAAALTAQGARVLGAEESAETFERLHSVAASSLSAGDIEQWVARSRSAVRNLAHADYEAAREDLLAAQALSERAAEELNREAARARQVLDTCLYMVRALVETGDEERARAQARECRHLVTRVQASPSRHTPEVRAILETIDRQMAREPQGRLEVTSDPPGCEVRVNGIPFGRTPFALDEVALGEYRLQVECPGDDRGRVRRLRIGQGSTQVHVDARFDAAIESHPRLLLHYPTSEAEQARRAEDAAVVASIVGGRVLLVTRVDSSSLRLDLLEGSGSAVSVVVPVDTDGGTGHLDEAVAAVLAGRSLDLRDDVPVEIAPWQAPAPEAPPQVARPSRPREETFGRGRASLRISGIALGATGFGALAAATLFHGLRIHYGHEVPADPADPTFLDRQSTWANARQPTLALASAGSALATAALALAVPGKTRVPWWSYTVGAVGLGLLGYGIYESVSLPSCDQTTAALPSCRARDEQIDRASLLGAIALPLVTLPLVHLLRGAPALDVQVSTARAGAAIQFGGAF